MTAIAGLWRHSGASNAAEFCQRMLSAQKIYGPHDTSLWDGGQISLGRNLFRLLPEDIHDLGTVEGGGGSQILVADLRLDNRSELLSELAVRPSSDGLADAQILSAAWERWGSACLDRIVGDYAFAVWDARAHALFLARDPLGQRPLHYHLRPDFVAFASMPKGLHALPDVPFGADEERLAEYLAYLPASGGRSFYKGINAVEPGCLVTASASGVRSTRFWDPKRQTLKLNGPEEYAEALREKLDLAVDARLRRLDSRIGSQLSGGWDSSAVSATAARLLSARGERLTAFTAVPPKNYRGPIPEGTFGDEGPYASETARLYPNIDHILVASSGRSAISDLDENFYLHERPLLNICNAVWLKDINRSARDRCISVLLCGTYGNLGLTDKGTDWIPELFAQGRFFRWYKEGQALVRNGAANWRGVLGSSLGPWIPAAVWVWLHRMRHRPNPAIRDHTLVSKATYDKLGLARRGAERGIDPVGRPARDTYQSRLQALRWDDLGTLHKGYLGDCGIDHRDPTTDRRLVEFCLSVPMDQLLVEGRPRSLARRALSDRLPSVVLNEDRWGYQGLDWHVGLSQDDISREFGRMEQSELAQTVLDTSNIRELIQKWPEDMSVNQDVSDNYRWNLLRAISVCHFLRRASRHNG